MSYNIILIIQILPIGNISTNLSIPITVLPTCSLRLSNANPFPNFFKFSFNWFVSLPLSNFDQLISKHHKLQFPVHNYVGILMLNS